MRDSSLFAAKVRARVAANINKKHAIAWVQEAMKLGLEWAIRNPRPFLTDSGVVDGTDLTDGEQEAVIELLKDLHHRLTSGKRPLWRGYKGPRGPRGPNRSTLEKLAAAHGARRGW